MSVHDSMNKPQSWDGVDQADGLRRLSNQKPVQVIAVTGGKGGVGKSSVCANLGVALSMLDRKVMILDGDLGLANIDVMFGLQPRLTLAMLLIRKQRLQMSSFRVRKA